MSSAVDDLENYQIQLQQVILYFIKFKIYFIIISLILSLKFFKY